MSIKEWRKDNPDRLKCPVCNRRFANVGKSVGVCAECIRNHWEVSRSWVEAMHAGSREVFQLPLTPPEVPDGIACSLCPHACRMGAEDKGYCGIRSGNQASFEHDGRLRAQLSYYYDPLPTNCVADWVCAGGTGAGYPKYAHTRGTEVGFYNLAVFFEACNFNCLFCQNWSFKETQLFQPRWLNVDALARAVKRQTSCICYFGGDPTPQIPYALRVSRQLKEDYPERILRFCWETNGSVHPDRLQEMAKLSLDSGGCIKVDLKAWNPNIHKALCGSDNRRVLDNFSRLAKWVPLRPDPPLLVASTLLVPGYVDEEEVWNLASFIAQHDPDIPYVLLGFAPQFCLEDFPTTSRAQANACLEAARNAGLRRVRLGNQHLIGARC